jgi:hypothetical protein
MRRRVIVNDMMQKGKYMTDCRGEFPAGWFARAKLCSDRHDPYLNYFGVNASQSLAEWRSKRLDPPPGSARMVSVVLPVLHGPEDARRRAADSAMAAAGRPALGL